MRVFRDDVCFGVLFSGIVSEKLPLFYETMTEGNGEVGLLCVMIVGQISRLAPLTRDDREGYRGYLRDFSSGTMFKSCDCVCEFELSVYLEMIRWQDGVEFKKKRKTFKF